MTEFHGWALTNERWALHIGFLPGRKRVLLYLQDDAQGVIYSLASFTSEENARIALERFDRLIPTREASA